MKEHLHAGPADTADIEALKNEVSDLRQKVEQLTVENNELKQRVRIKKNSTFLLFPFSFCKVFSNVIAACLNIHKY